MQDQHNKSNVQVIALSCFSHKNLWPSSLLSCCISSLQRTSSFHRTTILCIEGMLLGKWSSMNLDGKSFEPRSDFISRLSMIVWVNVVLNRTVVADSHCKQQQCPLNGGSMYAHVFSCYNYSKKFYDFLESSQTVLCCSRLLTHCQEVPKVTR